MYYTGDPKYKLTYDYLGGMVKDWERMLLPLNGRPLQILEIGSYEGRSAIWFSDNIMSHPDARLTCVDLWPGKHSSLPTFDLNIPKTANGHKVNRIQGLSADVVPKLTGSFDLIYIDGSHEAKDVLTDWVNVLPLCKSKTIVGFDDYEWDDDKMVRVPPKPAVDCVLHLWAAHINILHKAWQVWVQFH